MAWTPEEGKHKYKMFRNFMVNELNITKEDIEQWTKDAVAEVVKNIIESDGGVKKVIEEAMIKKIMLTPGWTGQRPEDVLRKEILDGIIKRISSVISIAIKTQSIV